MTNVTGQRQRVRQCYWKLTWSMTVCVCVSWSAVWFSTYSGPAHIHIWQPVLPCLNPVAAGIWIMSSRMLQAWLLHAVCSLIVGHCHFLTTLAPSFRTSVISTLLELFMRFKKTVFKIPEISRRKKWCWMGSHATPSFCRNRLSVYFDENISWR